jgi:hypothetical protein
MCSRRLRAISKKFSDAPMPPHTEANLNYTGCNVSNAAKSGSGKENSHARNFHRLCSSLLYREE